jgi:hypothetical protein
MIDVFGYQSEYQRRWLIPKLAEIRPVQEIYGYKPYYTVDTNYQGIKYQFNRAWPYFGAGRCSRDDAVQVRRRHLAHL